MRDIFKRCVVFVLMAEARLVLRKYRPHIVAVVGSVGKTSTKDAIYTLLSRHVRVRKSEKSFNSEVGLPLTILGVPNAWSNPLRWLQNFFDGLSLLLLPSQYPEWLVLEIGADRPGDISKLASWLTVDIVVITRLPDVPVHVEYFDSPEAVVEEKASIINALRSDGALVLYGDDARTKALAARAKERNIKALTYGFAAEADVRATNVELLFEEGRKRFPIGMRAHVFVHGETLPVSLAGVVGGHMLFAILAATAVGEVLKKDFREELPALQGFEPPSGRMRLLLGVKETLLIDDTYNSSPAAAIAALDALALCASGMRPKGRRVAVLADMLELGKHSVEEHRALGAHAAQTSDLLMTVGFRARNIAQGALDAGMPDIAILQYEDAQAAGAELQNLLQPGDCVLVKGSQSMRMEKVVEEVMAEPNRAAELLVRQDAEWKKR